MNRSSYPFTAPASRGTLLERLLAKVIAVVFILAALLFNTLLLVSGLLFAVRSWWRERQGRPVPADRTINLAVCNHEVIPRQPGVFSSPEDKTSRHGDHLCSN